MEPDRELDILEHIYQNPDSVRQRDLAHIAGVSLGMINVILKRLVDKGWIKMQKINNRNIKYMVSPDGIEALSRRSYRFFKRTVKNLVLYKDALEKLILEIKHSGYSDVVLIGPSQVDFLVEHFCMKYGLVYRSCPGSSDMSATSENPYFLHSEEVIRNAGAGDSNKNCTYLRDIFFRKEHVN